jgi:hypothetical protein
MKKALSVVSILAGLSGVGIALNGFVVEGSALAIIAAITLVASLYEG